MECSATSLGRSIRFASKTPAYPRGVLPADLLFYDAAESCRLAGKPEAGLVCLNRFVDIQEVISSGDLSITNIEHTRFKATDVPSEICLRTHSSVSEMDATKMNNWVLGQNVRDKIQPKPPMAA
jgi:hypothetical protein